MGNVMVSILARTKLAQGKQVIVSQSHFKFGNWPQAVATQSFADSAKGN